MATSLPPRPLPAWVRHTAGDPAALGGLYAAGDPAALGGLADRDLLGAIDHGAGSILAAAAAVRQQLSSDRSGHALDALAGGIEALVAQVEATTRAARLMRGETRGLPRTAQAEVLRRLDRAGAAAEDAAADLAGLLERLEEDAP